jgi:hypothetical protein
MEGESADIRGKFSSGFAVCGEIDHRARWAIHGPIRLCDQSMSFCYGTYIQKSPMKKKTKKKKKKKKYCVFPIIPFQNIMYFSSNRSYVFPMIPFQTCKEDSV